MFICVAGKNNIAVNTLQYIIKNYTDCEFGVVCNGTECGEDRLQRSLRLFAAENGIPEYSLADLYNKKDMVFLSLEFDKIVNPDLFLSRRLYNIHFSYLPEYKGMFTSAIPILQGAAYSGVTLHKIDKGIDTGDIISQVKFELPDRITCKELYLLYVEKGTELVISNLEKLLREKEVDAYPQPSAGATYFSRKYIDYSNIKIDLRQTAASILRQIDAFCFREYQLPIIHGERIIDGEILDSRSFASPGEIIRRDGYSMVIATIDYDVEIFIDRFEELMKACSCGDLNCVQGINHIQRYLEEKDIHGWTPLIVAVYNNQKEVVKYLINQGADIRAVNNHGTNLLMYAKEAYLRFGDSELLKFFYSNGILPTMVDYYNKNLYDYLSEVEMNKIEKIFSC